MEKTAEIYQPLFDLMSKEHGLILTISEMDEILNTSARIITNYGKSFEKERGITITKEYEKSIKIKH